MNYRELMIYTTNPGELRAPLGFVYLPTTGKRNQWLRYTQVFGQKMRKISVNLHISQKSCTFAAQKDTDHEFTDRNIFF